ncbi:hypothetical protein ARMA_1616 [Ardenticatena maritima]|uniref:Uncharacterized protein n=1 Tax=Ardenticatena maritima TaxID=872965 RepID=A0A0M8K758_9CHLR|nr:hypothetical protein ARMA_1616 [Ardenticatena maritima]
MHTSPRYDKRSGVYVARITCPLRRPLIECHRSGVGSTPSILHALCIAAQHAFVLFTWHWLSFV